MSSGELKYEIIKSGSQGNCVIVKDMMFDCGIPFSTIRQKLYKVRYLLITHTHSDHLNANTFHKIIKEFPRIKTIGNWHVSYQVPLNQIIGSETVLEFKDRTIEAFECVHDVPTTGFVVRLKDHNLIYATDTNSLEHAPDIKYDYFFIESNHDEKIIEAIRSTSRKVYGYDAWKGAMRHLSTQKSKAFYYTHRKDKESQWIELHKSERFYSE